MEKNGCESIQFKHVSLHQIENENDQRRETLLLYKQISSTNEIAYIHKTDQITKNYRTTIKLCRICEKYTVFFSKRRKNSSLITRLRNYNIRNFFHL